MSYTDDTIVWPTLTELSTCLCNEIAVSGLPAPCFCGVLPGAEVAYDYCDGCSDGTCGQAWVRLSEEFPSVQFPNVDEAATCSTTLAFVLEVGIMRCAPVGDSQGNPPTLAQQVDAVQLQLADKSAMRRAIACCMGASDDIDYVLGSYAPDGPQGGCVGGLWTVTIRRWP